MMINAKSIYLAPLLKGDLYLKPLRIASDFKSSRGCVCTANAAMQHVRENCSVQYVSAI